MLLSSASPDRRPPLEHPPPLSQHAMAIISGSQPEGSPLTPGTSVSSENPPPKLEELGVQPDAVNGTVTNGAETPGSYSTEDRKPSRLETVASYPVSDLTLEDHCIDDFRPLRVAVIGAGLSGILSGILLPLKVPNIQLTIFEKSKEVVGRQVPAMTSFSEHFPGANIVIDRAVPGLTTYTQVSDATFHPMSIRLPSPPICNGQSSLPRELRFWTTGRT